VVKKSDLPPVDLERQKKTQKYASIFEGDEVLGVEVLVPWCILGL